MTTQSNRSCATCASFCSRTPEAAPECWNLVTIVEHRGTPLELHRPPGPDDFCDDHLLPAEEACTEMAERLSRLPADCLTVLDSYVECAKVFGYDHPQTHAVFQRAADRDPTGYLSSLIQAQPVVSYDPQILAAASPEFHEAMKLAGHLRDTLGIEHPETSAALSRAMEIAPEGLFDFIHEKAVEMGLLPASPDGFTEEGQAVYTLEGFAARMGITLEEAEEAASAMVADRAALGLPTGVIGPDVQIHRVH